MCGIAGILSLDSTSVDPMVLQKMLSTLKHRGPDGLHIWNSGPIGLAHARLSIIDLNPISDQPMHGNGNKHSIVFNGEIYNFRELRAELVKKNISLRTSSDTEVLLEGYALEGIDYFQKLEGMFAAAIWDSEKLVLVRDRLGMKPLFICNFNKQFIFASEPKAFFAAGVSPHVRQEAIGEYLWWNYTNSPQTIFQNIEQVDPATILIVERNGTIRSKKYWSIPSVQRETISHDLALKTLEKCFQRSIERHLVSDVPIGIFLSGGIDSSLIASFASKQSAALNSFSLGFKEVDDGNYQQFIERMSKQLGFRHTKSVLQAQDVGRLLLEMNELADEPLADAADVAVYYLSKQAAQNVKVVLSGDGGDEIFAGYSRHRAHLLAPFLSVLSKLAMPFQSLMSSRMGRRLNAFSQTDPSERYALLLSSLENPERDLSQLLPHLESTRSYRSLFVNMLSKIHQKDQLSHALSIDLQTILLDSYLRKCDRATMMASIEGRLPFLDKELIEFAFTLPSKFLQNISQGKILLRQLLHKVFPDYMTKAPKLGFVVPYAVWLNQTDIVEMRQELSKNSGALADLVSEKARKLLAAPAQNEVQAALQWKLLRLGLWSHRWIHPASLQAGSITHKQVSSG